MKILVLVLLTVVSVGLCAQTKTLSSVAATKEHAEQLAAQFVNGEYKQCFTDIKKYWPFDPAEIDSLESQTKASMTFAAERFGRVLESELVQQKTAGIALQRYVFLCTLRTPRIAPAYYVLQGKNGVVH